MQALTALAILITLIFNIADASFRCSIIGGKYSLAYKNNQTETWKIWHTLLWIEYLKYLDT